MIFIVILLIVVSIYVLVVLTSNKRDGAVPTDNLGVTTTTTENLNILTPHTDLAEDMIELNERYAAFTYYPRKGPSGLVLRIMDLQNDSSVKINTLFHDLPENAEFVSQDVLLPSSGTGSTVLLTFRTTAFAPDYEPEEFGGFPGDQLRILDFTKMESRVIDAPVSNIAYIPLSYSSDGQHVLLEKYVLVTMSKIEQNACWQQQIPCVKCLESRGYSILSIKDNTLYDVMSESELQGWLGIHSTSFLEYAQTSKYKTCSETSK